MKHTLRMCVFKFWSGDCYWLLSYWHQAIGEKKREMWFISFLRPSEKSKIQTWPSRSLWRYICGGKRIEHILFNSLLAWSVTVKCIRVWYVAFYLSCFCWAHKCLGWACLSLHPQARDQFWFRVALCVLNGMRQAWE